MKVNYIITRTVMLFASACALTLLSPKQSHAQCGDADGSGSANISDVVYMMNYLYAGGPAPIDFALTDIDTYEKLTIKDAVTSLGMATVCDFGASLCPPNNPPYAPTIDSNYKLIHLDSIPANTTQAQIPLAFLSPYGVNGMSLPFRLRIDGQIPTIDSIEILEESLLFVAETSWNSINADSGEIIIGNLNFYDASAYERFANIHITVPTSTNKQQVTLEWFVTSPEQAPTADSSIIPIVVADVCGAYGYEPVFMSTCCAVAGDASNSGDVNIGDATTIVSYVFAGGDAPPCLDEGDADGGGDVNIGDATYIVKYVFQSGDAPICGTTRS